MDTLLRAPWTVDEFLAWEDRQEGKHEFDGFDVIEMTGGSRAHQRIVFNLLTSLTARLDPSFDAVQEMRIRFGNRVRYPDVTICAEPVGQKVKTLLDAIAAFEVLSDETARTDRTIKLSEYAEIPSLQYYVLLEQDRIAVTIHHRQAGHWQTHAITEGKLNLPALGLTLPLAEIYARLQFQPPPG